MSDYVAGVLVGVLISAGWLVAACAVMAGVGWAVHRQPPADCGHAPDRDGMYRPPEFGVYDQAETERLDATFLSIVAPLRKVQP